MKNTKTKVTEKMLRDAFKNEHGKRAYDAFISSSPRYGGGTIHLIIAGSKNNRVSTELYSY